MNSDGVGTNLDAIGPKSRRRTVLLVGLAAITLLASVAFYPSLMPAEVVALAMNYSEGEKMIYDLKMTMDVMGEDFSITMTYAIEVLDKEGDTYTIQTTIDTPLLNHSYSVTARISENGENIEFLDLPAEFQQAISSFSFIPGNGFYFPLKEAKVGDSWQIPVDILIEQFNFTGTINSRITDVLSATVPAGTYDVFRLEITSFDLAIRYKLPTLPNMTETAEIRMTLEGYEYFEIGSCRIVEASFDMTTTTIVFGENVTLSMRIDMRLSEDL